jgi:two-component system sensor histidine kinase DesK
MDITNTPAGPTDLGWLANQRRWTRGWRRIVFPGVFLVYLLQVVGAVSSHAHGPGAIAGYALLVAFSAVYLMTLPACWHGSASRFRLLYGVLVALSAAEIAFAQSGAFVMWVFIVVVSVARLGGRAVPLVVGFTAMAIVIPGVIPSWHDSFSTAVNNGTAISIPMVGLAMFGFFQVVRGNFALAEARSEIARLAAENERTRIARDLHDLLGHSLTTITVKAGLARRLSSSDPEGAFAEIAEVETLARRSLAEVRAAVRNYRDVTLAGELASGKEILRAAGIVADFPSAVDIVDPGHQELFGWVLREGVTNIVRHSHASSCSVRLSASSVEIIDDGVGGPILSDEGLAGLRERVAAAGGEVTAGPLQPNGWRLQVSLKDDTRAIA